MIRKLSLLAWLLCLGAASRASAQRFVALGMPDSQVLAALQKFQRAVATGDRATVAGMVNYPVRVNRGPDLHTLLADRVEFLRDYEAVFTPDVKRAVAATRLSEVLGGIDGVPLGRGIVWLTSTCSAERPRRCHIGLSSVNLRTNTNK